jgi:hypothetical protein
MFPQCSCSCNTAFVFPLATPKRHFVDRIVKWRNNNKSCCVTAYASFFCQIAVKFSWCGLWDSVNTCILLCAMRCIVAVQIALHCHHCCTSCPHN